MVATDVCTTVCLRGEGQYVGSCPTTEVDRSNLAKVSFLIDSDTMRFGLYSIEQDRVLRFPDIREIAKDVDRSLVV